MTRRLRRVTAREIIAVLLRRGFVLSRSRDGHHIYRNGAGKRVTVPVHAGKTLHPKVLHSILEIMELTPEGLERELET